jgi:hypothetical protein
MAINLNNVHVQFYLGTEAEVNIINKETHERIGAPTLQRCDKVARMYDGRTATFLGKGWAEFKRRTLRTQDVFYVAPRGSLNLLSYPTMQRLGLSIVAAENAGPTQKLLTLSVTTGTAAPREEPSPSRPKEGEDNSTKSKATAKPTSVAALQADFNLEIMTCHLPVTFEKLRTVSVR